jgi:hypothetical protein
MGKKAASQGAAFLRLEQQKLSRTVPQKNCVPCRTELRVIRDPSFARGVT